MKREREREKEEDSQFSKKKEAPDCAQQSSLGLWCVGLMSRSEDCARLESVAKGSCGEQGIKAS